MLYHPCYTAFVEFVVYRRYSVERVDVFEKVSTLQGGTRFVLRLGDFVAGNV